MSFEPLIPYVQIPEPFTIPKDFFSDGFPGQDFGFPKPFGMLVATGVYLGAWLSLRLARKRGVDEKAFTSFAFHVVGIGFIGGHVFDTLFYFPEKIIQNPLILLMLHNGQSSFGGFLGAIIGAFVWRRRYNASLVPYADLCAATFPLGWVFGRMGCASAHDHPGLRSEAWYAVQYPGGGRFDLGLYEMVLTIPLALFFFYSWRKPQPWGYYMAWFATLYAPVRFLMDFLRSSDMAISDVRYGPLTPAQWLSFALFVTGLWLLNRLRGTRDDPASLAAPEPPIAFGGRPEKKRRRRRRRPRSEDLALDVEEALEGPEPEDEQASEEDEEAPAPRPQSKKRRKKKRKSA